MRKLMFICILFPFLISAQEIPASNEQQLETLADHTESEVEDDSWLQDLEHFRKHPLNLNLAGREELQALKILSVLQVEHFLQYRSLLGMLTSIYELQAIPSWDVHTIRLLLPFIAVSLPETLPVVARTRLKDGQQQLLFRIGRILEMATGYRETSGTTGYTGSPWKFFFRYRYQYKDLLQMGLVGEKDAGESFMRNPSSAGFDFYSIHFFIKKIGLIKALALGDFTVSLGQGLIHWQGLAFKKSAAVMNIKRQSAVLRHYNSAGEYLFHRGAGVTLSRKNWEATAFFSVRKLDANLGVDTYGNKIVTTIITSGYHRTVSEIDDKGTQKQIAAGGNFILRKKNWHIGLNMVAYRFSEFLQKQDHPYNLYALKGRKWLNASLDYSFTFRNIHFFGEAATDRNRNSAFINGALLSLAPSVDISLLYRNFSPQYQALYGNAFNENTQPSNERGLFAGLEWHLLQKVRLNLYADVFYFPWLKFRVDAPSRGMEYMVQIFYIPSKQVEWQTRLRWETKDRNAEDNSRTTSAVIPVTRQSWRTQFSLKINNAFTVRQRTELLWYDRRGDNPRQGYLLFTDIIYRPPLKPLSAVMRLAVFETGDYESRVYAYENDVMYSFSIPALSGRGHRYYITMGYDFNEHWSAWIRLAGTVFPGQDTSGSGPEEIQGGRKSEVKCQVRWSF